MRKTTIASLAVMACLTAAACTIKDTKEPPLSGPSEQSLSLQLTANPDVLRQDGASQSLIQVLARRENGQPASSIAMRAEITVGGQIVDFGRLSAKTLVTDANGRASVVYTAPAFAGDPVDNGLIVTIIVTPSESDFRSALARQLDIRLVPPGVILPPNGAPVAEFTSSPSNPSTGDSVVFDASPSTDDGTIVSYVWDFGDGSSATGKTTSHAYRSFGTFAVSLTVVDDGGKSAQVTHTVSVANSVGPSALFVFSPTSPATHQEIIFDASASRAAPGHDIVRYDWNFGSGNPGCCGPLITKSYDTAGTYNVTLTVTDDTGQKATATQSVSVSATGGNNPVASFTVSPSNPTTATTVNFNASGSSATGGATIVRFDWDFGDGAPGFGQTTNHVYGTAGTYVIRLTVTDSNGRFASTTQNLTVTSPTPTPAPAPTALFTFSPAQPNAGQAVNFDASPSSAGTGSTIVSYRWNYGDGIVQTNPNGNLPSGAPDPTATHTYGPTGPSGTIVNYTVTLTVTNSAGQSATTTNTVSVKTP